jgi:mono/diheme cytochrome c family protein
MISARMSRPAKVLPAFILSISLAVLATGCGTQKVLLSKSDPNYAGASLFNLRCSGCHTLSYAGARGSAANVRSKQYNNGPNFDQRCERPVTRVLYAIENGGFSGAIMPQNIVVGQQAIQVARFVATYGGRSAPKVPGQNSCSGKAVGTIPAAVTSTSTSSSTSASATSTAAKGGKSAKAARRGKAATKGKAAKRRKRKP